MPAKASPIPKTSSCDIVRAMSQLDCHIPYFSRKLAAAAEAGNLVSPSRWIVLDGIRWEIAETISKVVEQGNRSY